MNSFKKSEGCSKELFEQELQKIVRIQALKDNPNLMMGISRLFRKVILHDIIFMPFMYFDLPINDANQFELPISPHGCYYINFSPLHLDDPQTIIRTECERLRTFFSTNPGPQKEVWSQKRITKILAYGRKL